MTPKRLTARRAELGLAQQELAHLAGISAGYLSMLEHGKRPITAELSTTLEEALQKAPAARQRRRDAAERAVAAAMNKPHLRRLRADTERFTP